MLLEKKNAVIYGAGGAIGGAVARAFACEGAKVFLAGRTLAPLEAVAEEISETGGVAEAAQVDTLDEQAVEKHIGEVVKKTGGIDISFNAIGIGYVQGAPLVEMSLEEFTLPIADVMKTQFLTTTAAARHMTRKGSGVILAITATPARMAIPNSGSFGVACSAIEGLCRQLAGNSGLRAFVSFACGRLALRTHLEWTRSSASSPSWPAFPERRSRPVLRRERC